MPFYITLTSTRDTMPDPVALNTAVKGATDSTAVLVWNGWEWKGKKSTTWTAQQITAAQNALDSVAALTPQLAAQRELDASIIERALALALLDQINVIRAALPTPLGAITVNQAVTAIKNKAGTLS